VASGDNEALSSLFRRYAKVAHGIARRILRDPTEADDCVQEVFVYFHQKSRVFSSEKGTASSWIIQTIYHQALQYRMRLLLRSHRLGFATEDKPGDVGASAVTTDYEHSLEWAVGRKRLREMLRSLSSDQWDTLRLHFFEGYTLSEIAQKKGQSLGNIRHHFYRGLEKLRSSVFRAELNERISSDKK
jgi:RNA polymerase sigma-70 factor (ECF subfamily)